MRRPDGSVKFVSSRVAIGFQLYFQLCGIAYPQNPSSGSDQSRDEFFRPSDVSGWAWTKGTVFADGMHQVTFNREEQEGRLATFAVTPSVQETLARGVAINANSVHSYYRRNGFFRSWSARVGRKWQTHGLAQNPPSTRTETAEFELSLDDLRIVREGGELRMTGLCSYEITRFYTETGRDKPISRSKVAGIAVELRAAAPAIRRDRDSVHHNTSPEESDQFLQRLREECSAAESGDASQAEQGKPVAETAIKINGKTLDIKVFSRVGGGAGVIMPSASVPNATIYLPDTWIDNDRHAHVANELANIIIDAQDGDPTDGSAADSFGRSISPLMAESLSDRMTAAWARHLLSPKSNPYPFESWLPDDPKMRKSLFELCAKDTSPTWFFPGDSLKAIEKEYNHFADVLEKADLLVREGKYSEAVSFMRRNGRDYRCKVADAAEFHKQQVQTGAMPR